MKVYRLAREKYCRDLSGRGASLYPGRWNYAGTSMLYTATHPAIAVLEMLVHIDRTELPDDFCLVTIHVPDTISTSVVKVKGLPADWNNEPYRTETQSIGTEFIKKGKLHGLYVPCSILPAQKNLLLNPGLCATLLHIEEVQPFAIDNRLQDKG